MPTYEPYLNVKYQSKKNCVVTLSCSMGRTLGLTINIPRVFTTTFSTEQWTSQRSRFGPMGSPCLSSRRIWEEAKSVCQTTLLLPLLSPLRPSKIWPSFGVPSTIQSSPSKRSPTSTNFSGTPTEDGIVSGGKIKVYSVLLRWTYQLMLRKKTGITK